MNITDTNLVEAVEPTTDSPSPAETPNPLPTDENIGGMTLKKRPSDGTAPSTSPARRPIRSTSGPGRPMSSAASSGPPTISTNVQKRMERYSRVMPVRDSGVRINEQIRVPEIRVIDDNGQVGVMSPREAMDIARTRGVDLVEIVPNAHPPVCKLIDFGKWKYEQQKHEKLSKKSSHQQLLKEVRFHPHTDTHDFEFKLRHARNFLGEGHKVKGVVQFKGREVAYKQFGEELLKNFQLRLEDIAKVDQPVSMMGRTMTMVLSPLSKKKTDEAPKKGQPKDSGDSSKEISELGEKLKAAGANNIPSETETPEAE